MSAADAIDFQSKITVIRLIRACDQPAGGYGGKGGNNRRLFFDHTGEGGRGGRGDGGRGPRDGGPGGGQQRDWVGTTVTLGMYPTRKPCQSVTLQTKAVTHSVAEL